MSSQTLSKLSLSSKGNPNFITSLKFQFCLGHGAFGIVLQAVDVNSDLCAVKFIYPTDATEKEQRQILRECELASSFNHENIVKILNVVLMPFNAEGVKDVFKNLPEDDEKSLVFRDTYVAKAKRHLTVQFICIQMELCGENLRNWLKNRLEMKDGSMEEIQICRDIVSGLDYLHREKKIIHRDLKPENIMFSVPNFTLPIKIGDFGFCRKLHSPEESQASSLSFVGTKDYMAPEISTGKYSFQADLYSLGLVIWEVFQPMQPGERRNCFDHLVNDRAEHLVADNLGLSGIKQVIIDLTRRRQEERTSSIEKVLHILNRLKEFTQSVARRPATIPVSKPIWFGIAQPTPYFVGREAEVDQLVQLLLSRHPPAAVVSGMGGQGKTELCRQFIKALKSRDNQPSVTWLNGDKANNLTSSVTELALALQISITNSNSLEELLIKVSDTILTKSPNGWLIIIDNVDEMYPEFIQVVRVLFAHSAFVLVTSRRNDILPGEARQIKLDVLKDEDAHNLVITFMNQLPTKTEVENLCRELGNHVLALRQAIAYINAKQIEKMSSYGIKNYLNDLAKDLLKNKTNFLDDYDQIIFLVVTRTMQTIVDNYGEKGNFASEVMEILCLVRPEISIQSFHKIAEAAKVFHSESSAEELHQALLLLKKYSLITYDDQTFLSIHRLIQKVAKRNNSICVKTILKNLIVEVASVEELRQLISIWDHADQDAVKEYSNFPIQVFNKMRDLSLVLELKSFAEKNHQILHKLLGPDHEDTLRLEGCVGIALKETGNYDEALIKLKEVLEKNKQVFGEDHPQTLDTLSHIAFALDRLERYEESLEGFESLLQSRIRLHGSEHEKTMRARHNKAWVLHEFGRVDEALPLYQEVLEWKSKNLGSSHRSTLVTRFNMAAILYKKGQFEEAKTEFEILLSLNEKTFGKEYVGTIRSKYWLASAFWSLGRKDEALTMMTEVVELREKVLGTNHPNTQHSRDTISQWKAAVKENS